MFSRRYIRLTNASAFAAMLVFSGMADAKPRHQAAEADEFGASDDGLSQAYGKAGCLIWYYRGQPVRLQLENGTFSQYAVSAPCGTREGGSDVFTTKRVGFNRIQERAEKPGRYRICDLVIGDDNIIVQENCVVRSYNEK